MSLNCVDLHCVHRNILTGYRLSVNRVDLMCVHSNILRTHLSKLQVVSNRCQFGDLNSIGPWLLGGFLLVAPLSNRLPCNRWQQTDCSTSGGVPIYLIQTSLSFKRMYKVAILKSTITGASVQCRCGTLLHSLCKEGDNEFVWEGAVLENIKNWETPGKELWN